jgi:hypothetical protein
MTARTLHAASSETLLDQIEAARADGFTPTLILAFVHLRHDLKAAVARLKAFGVPFLGASTDGGITDGAVRPGTSVALLLDLDPQAFALFGDGGDPVESAARLGAFARERFAEPHVLALASGLFVSGDALVRAFRGEAGPDVPLFGGFAGSDFQQLGTHILTGGGVLPQHLGAVVFDGARVSVDSVAATGWKPVGEPMEVTRSDGSVVLELDGKPVLDVFRTYLTLDDDPAVNLGLLIRRHFPLALTRADGSEVLRASAYVEGKRKGLIFAGEVPQGSRVRFCEPPSSDLVSRLMEDAAALHARAPQADAVLMLSCRARHEAIGDLARSEAAAVAGLWEAPQIGFFAYGEFGAVPGAPPDFHNSTCSLVTLRAQTGAPQQPPAGA